MIIVAEVLTEDAILGLWLLCCCTLYTAEANRPLWRSTTMIVGASEEAGDDDDDDDDVIVTLFSLSQYESNICATDITFQLGLSRR